MIPQGFTEKRDPHKLILPADYKADQEKLESIINSVKQRELLHPPCIKADGRVFAGEVHVKAAQSLNLEHIECKVFPSNLQDEDYLEIAIHKTLQFPQISWDDQVLKERELHELRVEQHGKATAGRGKSGWSLRDTAEELSMSFGVLSEDLRMADAIANDPSLRRIKDKTTAKKVILAAIKRQNQQLSSSLPAQAETNVVLCGGSEKILEIYPNDIFDACITDPPWLEFKDKNLVKDKFTFEVFKQVWRVLKNNSFLFAFVGTQDWHWYYEKLQTLGFSVQKYPLIWKKEGTLSYGTLSWQTQRDYEQIILAVKGSPALSGNMVSSVISCKVVPTAHQIHPNEKPTEVIEKLLETCTYDKALVLDPFGGSGVVAEVCIKTGKRYVVIENSVEYFKGIQERIKKCQTT